MTKREQALVEIQHALAAVDRALTLLGGRTRNKPKRLTRTYTVRQYLEGVSSRLGVIRDLTVLGDD